MKHHQNISWTLFLIAIVSLAGFYIITPDSVKVEAATSNWQKGVSIDPRSPEDFGSDTFKQSLQNAKAMGANSVSLIIPYYQSTLSSSDMGPGWNTPTDSALINAVTYAHSLGLRVDLKPHLQVSSDPTAWRATIDASDRDSWYANYGTMLKHYASIAQSHHVENITIGTELITMASSIQYADNTTHWDKIIDDVRAVFSGTLTYSANWGSSGWYDEKNYIKFWDKLDYIGISAYLPLSTDPNYTVNDLKATWANWNTTQIKTLSDTWHKPIVFTEIGYRSVDGAMARPARWQTSGSVDLKEQMDGYQALFEYWSQFDYFNGINIWAWSSDPNAGGPTNNDFTPQGKPAQDLIKQWFTGAVVPSATPTPTPLSSDNIIIHASDVLSSNIHGNWILSPVADAADGEVLLNPDLGAAKASPLAKPVDYVDLTFTAQANTPYHLWLRMKATNDSYSNDSVSVQFSDSTDGNTINSINAWPVILENGHGAGDAGWGWNDNAYDGMGPNIIFATSGTHTIRLQAREDGIMFDQIVLSPSTYINASPGLFKNDTTILSKPAPTPRATPVPTATPTPTVTPTPTSTPTPSPTTPSIWWPTNGVTVTGVQPFKGLLENWDLRSYNLYWQVDGDRLNVMGDSNVDWPHKEASVDLSGWNWNADGFYHLNFIAKDLSGSMISQKSLDIHTK